MTEEELDAAVDVIAAVDAGVLESLNQRIKQRTEQLTTEVKARTVTLPDAHGQAIPNIC